MWAENLIQLTYYTGFYGNSCKVDFLWIYFVNCHLQTTIELCQISKCPFCKGKTLSQKHSNRDVIGQRRVREVRS